MSYLASVGRGDPPMRITSACSMSQRTRALRGGSMPSSQPTGRTHVAAYNSCMYRAGCDTSCLEKAEMQ